MRSRRHLLGKRKAVPRPNRQHQRNAEHQSTCDNTPFQTNQNGHSKTTPPAMPQCTAAATLPANAQISQINISIPPRLPTAMNTQKLTAQSHRCPTSNIPMVGCHLIKAKRNAQITRTNAQNRTAIPISNPQPKSPHGTCGSKIIRCTTNAAKTHNPRSNQCHGVKNTIKTSVKTNPNMQTPCSFLACLHPNSCSFRADPAQKTLTLPLPPISFLLSTSHGFLRRPYSP